jgi:hypothetical protein
MVRPIESLFRKPSRIAVISSHIRSFSGYLVYECLQKRQHLRSEVRPLDLKIACYPGWPAFLTGESAKAAKQTAKKEPASNPVKTKKIQREQIMAETNKKLEDEAEQTAAHDEPMGSVAAAVPRDRGSALKEGDNCPPNHAPDHEGGHATIVAGTESHVADQPEKDTKKPH